MLAFGDNFSNYNMRENLPSLLKQFMFCIGESDSVNSSIKKANEKFLEYKNSCKLHAAQQAKGASEKDLEQAKAADEELLEEANKLKEIAILKAETFYLGIIDRGNFLLGKSRGAEYTKRAIEFSDEFLADYGMTREEVVYVSQLFYPIHRSFLKRHDPEFASMLDKKFLGEKCSQDGFKTAGRLESLSTIRRDYYRENKTAIDSKTEDDGDTFFR